MLRSLDFIYAPSSDVAADVRRLVDVLGAELVFAIGQAGTRVAMLRLGADGPAMLLTDHLPDDRPIFIYRVASVAEAEAQLAAEGWTPERTIELPMGPCMTLTTPGGTRLAVYELTRPGVVDSMAGQRDF